MSPGLPFLSNTAKLLSSTKKPHKKTTHFFKPWYKKSWRTKGGFGPYCSPLKVYTGQESKFPKDT